MNTFKRLKHYYWPFKNVFIWSILAMLITIAITVVYPVILQITIDDIVLGGQYQLAAWVGLGFIGVMIIKGAATFFHQYLGDMFGIRSVYQLRNGLYGKLQRLSFSYYDNAKTGDLMSRLTADVEGLRFFLSYGLAEFIRFILLVSVSLSVMFYYSVSLTIVTIAVLPFLAAAVYRFDKKVHPAFRGIRTSFASLNTKVQENISGIHTVKSLSREDFQISGFNKANQEYRSTFLKTSTIWSAYFPLMELIGNMSIVALLSYGGYLVMNNQLNPGELVAFFSLVSYMMWPIMNLGFVINMFSQAKASSERLLDILDQEEEMKDQPGAAIIQDVKGTVRFSGVSFSYRTESKQALSGINFEAGRGKVIGLMGPTGSGKSTITQLLSRFYEPSGGTIFLDEQPLSEYSLQSLRSRIGVVLQESFLFSSTIRSNISYGNPEAAMEDVMMAAKKAQAHDFIMELPDGYDTMLGERGMGLSGGQKQRIAIARAICLQPDILLLDDATSAVDMETERNIQAGLKEVMKHSITFIIAHRISSLKHADEILVLQDGAVTERGTHEELLAKSGYYKKIHDIQYKDLEAVQMPHQVG